MSDNLHVPKVALPYGSWLGVLGGGQLGRMFCIAAQSMGYRVCVLDPAEHCPTSAIADQHIMGEYTDPEALQALSDQCMAITTEFENVPAKSLEFLARAKIVSPAASCVSIAQDRIIEKEFLQSTGVAVAPFAAIRTESELEQWCVSENLNSLLPGILKSARLGYDGKGQITVTTPDELRTAWHTIGKVACVLEKRLALVKEISVLVVRGFDGQIETFSPSENMHREGILAMSTVPAKVADDVIEKAREAAMTIATDLNYMGVLCVEFFILKGGVLVANEMAPRPHNSGHYSIDACFSSQFEQQVRVMAGLPLGSTHQHSPCVMLNILGDAWFVDDVHAEPDWTLVLREPGAKLHLYGKTDARPGRKMGHITVVGEDAAKIAQRIWVSLRLHQRVKAV